MSKPPPAYVPGHGLLTGKTVLITAAAGTGIGFAAARRCVEEGAMVVITGNDLSMGEVVQLLTDTLKEARKAAEQYDVKTFQSMMRDRSKKTST